MRLPRYRLRTLLIAVAVAALGMGTIEGLATARILPPPGRSPPGAEQRCAVVRHVHRPPIPPLGAIRAGTGRDGGLRAPR